MLILALHCAQKIFDLCKKRDPDQKEFLQVRVLRSRLTASSWRCNCAMARLRTAL